MSKATTRPADLSALSGLAPELAQMLVSVACDIALVLDDGGVIRNVAVGGTQPVASTAGGWVGRRWTDTVTGSMRRKARAFLADLASTGVSRLRRLSHASIAGSDIPVAYTAVRLGDHGVALAVGRDMSPVSAMQRRLVRVQHEIERDYWQRRHAESRYRLLFQLVAEPVLILDAASFEVVDANPAATLLLERDAVNLAGAPLERWVEAAAKADLRQLLEIARRSALPMRGDVQLADGHGRAGVCITAFRSESQSVLLLLFGKPSAAAPQRAQPEAEASADAMLAALVRRTPDPVVLCDFDGQVTLANQAFRGLVQLASGEPLAGRRLQEWIGSGDDWLAATLAAARRDGFVRLLGTWLRRHNDCRVGVELSATLIPDLAAVGFILRVSPHQDAATPPAPDMSERDPRGVN